MSTVVPLVDVLMHVLDGLDAAANLHVDVAIVLQEEGGVVGDDPLVAKLDSSAGATMGMPPGNGDVIVGAGVGGVGVVADHGGRLERLGEVLAAGAILHARGVGVVAGTTGAMEHVLSDGCEETGLGVLVGELGGDEGVNVFGCAGLVFGGEMNEDVGVRKATFLELNDVKVG